MGLGALRGKDAKLYRNTGTNASPTWIEVENVRDLSMPQSWGEADVSSRISDIKMYLKALLDAGVEFGMVKDSLDADYLAIRAAFYSATAAIQFAIMDGSILTPGSRGLKMFCQVFNHTEEQNLEDGQMVTVSIKPTRYYESSALVVPEELVIV